MDDEPDAETAGVGAGADWGSCARAVADSAATKMQVRMVVRMGIPIAPHARNFNKKTRYAAASGLRAQGTVIGPVAMTSSAEAGMWLEMRSAGNRESTVPDTNQSDPLSARIIP